MEEVLAKYFSNEASKDEITFVNTWKSESDSNAKEYFDAKLVWLSTQKREEPPQEILNSILDKSENEKAREKQFFLAPSFLKYAVAASVILAISIALIFSGDESLNFRSEDFSDGSVISLHGNSTYEVIAFTEDVREIKVTGKTYFDIERDETRPFIIHTNNATIKVLGTSFVVDNYEGKTEVLVESGLVELIKNDTESNVSVKLTKGEKGLIRSNNKGIIKGSNENANYLSWKTKVLTFNNSSIAEVSKTLEDVYGITVEIENQDFNDCRLTAKFNKKRAKDALEIIARTFNVEFELNKNKALIKGRGC